MISTTRQHNKLALALAFTLFFVGVIRFPFIPDVRTSFVVVMEYGMALALMMIIFIKANEWVALFFGLALLRATIPLPVPQPDGSITYLYTGQTYSTIQGMFYALAWYLFLTEFLKEKYIPWILNVIVLIALANIIMQILQYFNYDFLFKPTKGTNDFTIGLMTNPLEIGALLCFCMPAFFRKKFIYLFPLLLIGLYLSGSAFSVFNAAIGILFFALFQGYFLYALGVCLIAVPFYFYFRDMPNYEVRLDVWSEALRLWKKHWILGSGLGHWQFASHKLAHLLHLQEAGIEGWWKHLHNEYLQALFEMGIGSMVFTGGYFIKSIRDFQIKALLPATALLIIAINSFANFPFHIAPTAFIAVTWMAVYTIQTREKPLGFMSAAHSKGRKKL